LDISTAISEQNSSNKLPLSSDVSFDKISQIIFPLKQNLSLDYIALKTVILFQKNWKTNFFEKNIDAPPQIQVGVLK